MPHVRLEYTDNVSLDAPEILKGLNSLLLESKLFEEMDIKARAVQLDNYLVGTTVSDRAFVHVQIDLLSGRNLSARSELSARALAYLTANGTVRAKGGLQISVDVREIARETYAKAQIAGCFA